LIVLLQKTIQTLPSILKVIFIDPFEQNLSFTFFLLQLLLLSNDVAENPGPDNKVGDLTVFHWNARSVRKKIEYLETICLGDLYATHTRILYLGKLTSIHINSPLLNSKSYRRDAWR
jgi:hypothetical protein